MAAPTLIANMATRKEATVAWTCTKAMLPTIMRTTFDRPDMLPRFTCVERREARHMSRLPFRPSSAGTRMNSSLTFLKTYHFCKEPIQYYIYIYMCVGVRVCYYYYYNMLVIVYFISCGPTCLPGLSNIKSIGNDLWLCINLIINKNNDVIYRFSSASSRLPACLPA